MVVIILGGLAGGAYYFTDGFGTKNTSIVGNWKRGERKYHDGTSVVWKFFDNGTLFLGNRKLYCSYEINGDILKVNIDPLDMADSDMDCEIEYTYKIERNTLTLKTIDDGHVLEFERE